jgi:hypothetical protein
MLDQLTVETFQPLVASSFWLHHEGHRVELRLTAANRVMESEAARLKRTPFSLHFLSPLLLPQAIYRVTHDAIEAPLDIFLVPVGKEAGGYVVEAVFA